MKNLTMHLTNYSINKFAKNFIFNTDENAMDVGHKRNVKFVFEYLKE